CIRAISSTAVNSRFISILYSVAAVVAVACYCPVVNKKLFATAGSLYLQAYVLRLSRKHGEAYRNPLVASIVNCSACLNHIASGGGFHSSVGGCCTFGNDEVASCSAPNLRVKTNSIGTAGIK